MAFDSVVMVLCNMEFHWMSTEALNVPQCAMPCFPNCQHFSRCTERGLYMSHRVGIGCCVGSCTQVFMDLREKDINMTV